MRSQLEFAPTRINKLHPNDQALGVIICREKPQHDLTLKYPNDQDLGREFRKYMINTEFCEN